MEYHDSLLGLIGETPLVRLGRLAPDGGPLVLAKAEYLNPGGSVKDRIALGMVRAAEADGRLRPGGTIVEPTSGNTGAGLAIVASLLGYRCLFTCPDKVSAARIDLLRAYGAEVVVCPAAVPPDDPRFYRNVARELAAAEPGRCLLDQYSNAANPAAHHASTGPEIWRQTDGRVTHFVAGLGTGGTLSGTGRYLKEVSGGAVTVVGVDPDGSRYTGATLRPYLLEGVGQPSLPAAYDPDVADELVTVTDRDALTMTHRLAREEALLTGGSGGMAVAAALRVAGRLPADAVVVVIVPDSGRGYLGTIFDEEWMGRRGFPVRPVTSSPLAGDVAGDLVLVHPDSTAGDALTLLAAHGLPAAPVSAATPPVRLPEVVGTVTAARLEEALARGETDKDEPVRSLMAPPPDFTGTGLPAPAPNGVVLVMDGGLVTHMITGRYPQ